MPSTTTARMVFMTCEEPVDGGGYLAAPDGEPCDPSFLVNVHMYGTLADTSFQED
jgi:hypothetical protein